MQVKLNKVRVIDTRSAFHDQLVDLSIENGIITEIKTLKKAAGKPAIISEGKEVWQGKAGEELLISNGWVDVFADYREPGLEHKETIETGHNAAAAGGFTDVLITPNTQPAISSKSIIQYILQKASGHAVTAHPMGAATQNAEGKELAEMMDMSANGAIAFTDGWKPVQNANLLLKALEYVKAFDGTIVQLPVDAALASGGLMNEGIVSTALGMPGIPMLAETLTIYRDIELVRYTGSKLHITGVSAAESVAMIRKAKADGLAVTCSVTPYHLALTDDMLNTYDSAYKVSPPLRTESDRLALVAALADGTIDCIASHHRPHEWDAKTKEFEYAADGMAIQESAFNIIWDTLKEYISIERLVDALAVQPRNIFGIEHTPIEQGGNVCLTIFSTSGSNISTTTTKKSASMNNPFLDKSLSGKVLGIINNNKLKLDI
jgi:dihydroorotase